MNREMSAAKAFKALGDETRWHIVSYLACCPRDADQIGTPTAGDVCCHVSGAPKITSTVSHHLHELREAGILQIERRGKNMVCSLDRQALKDLAQALITIAEGEEQNECCCC